MASVADEYLKFRQNLGRSGNSGIPDRLGFFRHMKTRLKTCRQRQARDKVKIALSAGKHAASSRRPSAGKIHNPGGLVVI